MGLTVWLAGPRILATWATSRLERATKRLPGAITLGHVEVLNFTTIEVGGVAWEDADDWSLQAGPIVLTLDWSSVLVGGSPIREVRVRGLVARLGDPSRPMADPREALARIRRLVGGERASDASVGARSWPVLSGDEVSVSVHMTGGLSARVSGGRFRLGPPEGALDTTGVRVLFEGSLLLEDGIWRTLKAEGTWARSAGWTEGDISVEPALMWDSPSGRVRASGARFRPGEITILGASWDPGGTVTLEAVEVTLRTEAGSNRDDGMSRTTGPTPQPIPNVSAWLASFMAILGDRHPTEIVVSRPVLTLEVPARADGGTQVSIPTPSLARSEGAFREGLLHRYRHLDQIIGRAAQVCATLAESLPVDTIQVHGATVRYRRDGMDLRESLARLEAALTTDRKKGVLSGRLTFECPEAAPGTNEIGLSYDTRRLSGFLSARIRRLPLGPYAGLAPPWFLISDATILGDSEFEVRLEPGGIGVSMDGTLSLKRAGLFLPAVAAVPMTDLTLLVQGRFTADRTNASVKLERGLFSFGNVRIPFEMSADHLDSWPRVRLTARVERIRAQDLISSIPENVIPALKGVRIAGSFAATAELDVDTRDMSALKFDFRPDVADLSILDPGQGVNLDLLRTEFYHRIDEGGGKVIERVVGPSSPSWVPLEEVPRFVVDALTTSEDSQFFRHHGFSLAGIRRSLRVNLERGGFYQGASTLSQQLAKNLFLSPEKTLARKLQEAFITWQLERFLSKEKILELYLNVVEWGPEVYGLREAALHYFGKIPAELTPLEAAYLVSILPNPKMFHRHYESGSVSPAFDRRVRDLLREMARRGLLSQEDLARYEGRRIRFAQPNAPAGPPDDEPQERIPDEEFSDDG